MGLTVREKAEFIGTFRWIEVFLMEMLARWTPSTPEMEVKILLGRHTWDCAQHADGLGKRSYELRAPLHYTLTPVNAYKMLFDEAAELSATTERVAILYDAILPALAERYQYYLDHSDLLLDEPSFRVIQRNMQDIMRMRREGDDLRNQPDMAHIRTNDASEKKASQWSKREAAVGVFVAHGPGPALARDEQAAIAGGAS